MVVLDRPRRYWELFWVLSLVFHVKFGSLNYGRIRGNINDLRLLFYGFARGNSKGNLRSSRGLDNDYAVQWLLSGHHFKSGSRLEGPVVGGGRCCWCLADAIRVLDFVVDRPHVFI